MISFELKEKGEKGEMVQIEHNDYSVIKQKKFDKDKENKAFVLITGPKLLTGIKRRKCNIEHLEPTEYSVEIKDDASDEEVIAALDKTGLVNKLGLKKPSAAEMKAQKAKPVKEEKPKEKSKEKPKKEDKKEKKK